MPETNPSSRPLRVFHGTTNVGGIGRYMADWERANGCISDFIVYQDNTNRKNSHINLHLDLYSIPGKLWAMLSLFSLSLFRYDLFHFYAGSSFLPFNLDLPILKLFGKKIIMTYVGTDVRLSEVEQKRNPYFHYMAADTYSPSRDRRKRRMMAWHNLWIDRCLAIRNVYASAATTISSNKIVRDIWVINTIEIKDYTPNFETNKIPRIVHAPTNPAVKGTAVIERVVSELKAEGYQFDFILLHRIPHDRAVEILQTADIIIDQLYVGGFGNLSMEAMAFGKPVCAYLIEEIAREYPDLPVVNVNADTLKEKLIWLIQNPTERVRLGQAGRCFAEQHYDRDVTARKLLQLYHDVLKR